MTPTEINNYRDQIVAAVERQELTRAIGKLSSLAAQLPDAALRDKLDQVKTSYDLMLHYLSQGILDPARDQVLNHIVRQLLQLTDQCVIAMQEKDSPEVFYARRRELQAVPLSDLVSLYRTECGKLSLLHGVDEASSNRQVQLQVMKSREQCETRIFNKVWSSFPTTQADAEVIGQFIADDTLPEPARCLMVMALLLGLTKFYDENKLVALIDAYTSSSSSEVQLRAIIGTLLALNTHRRRAELSRTLASHIAVMTEASTWRADVAMVMYRLIGTRNTDRVTQRVTQEIMPDIMKASPGLMRKMMRPGTEIDPDELEGNPEWQEMLENSGVAAKMEQFSQLQQEGSDVFISTFSRLKTFPFFHTLSNWFMPFHSDHSVVQEAFDESDHLLRDMVVRAPFLCNSDRYSFCLTLRSMPASQRELIRTQTQQQMADLDEMQAERVVQQRNLNRDTIATRCVQDLYRFFKLFSRRREFLAVMDTAMDFTGLPYLSAYTDSAETLQVVAEFYLTNEFDNEAVHYFSLLLKAQESTDPVVLQKLGFAHERLGNTHEALKQYQRYELVRDDDLWTLRHIASCYRTLHKPDKALEYYKRIDRLKPGLVSTTLNMGHTLLEQGRTDEALQCYFKADLMDERRHRAWRPIAWCSFVLGNDERSLDYYNRIIQADKPTMTDYVNRGHVHLCTGNLAQAVSDYRHAVQLGDADATRETILTDLPQLQRRGVSEQDVRLAIDAAFIQIEK